MSFPAKRKKIVPIFIVLTLTFICVGVLYFYWQQSSAPPKTDPKTMPVDISDYPITSPFENLSESPTREKELTSDFTAFAFDLSGLTSLPSFTGDAESWASLLYANQYVANISCTTLESCELNFKAAGNNKEISEKRSGVNLTELCPIIRTNVLVDDSIYGYTDNLNISEYLDRDIDLVLTFNEQNIFVDELPDPEGCIYYVY